MVCVPNSVRSDRAMGALIGGALGDALGMPTQTLSVEQIARLYGRIADFVAPDPSNVISRGLPAAAITDDTEQTLLLAGQIIDSPDQFHDRDWADLLLSWEAGVKARNLHDLLGPSTKRALEALLEGIPANEAGRHGNTNGAAMRIAPAGIATPCEPLPNLVDRVEQTCRLTHNTAEAISSASAVAAAISAAVDGAESKDAIVFALEAAREGERRGYGQDSCDVADRIALALEIVSERSDQAVWQEIDTRIGTSSDSRASVPAAFAIFKVCCGNAWQAGLISANIGGDTDTIGAIAAGMAGAVGGASSLAQDKVARLMSVNKLKFKFEEIVAGLLEVRRSRSNQPPKLERAV